MQFTKNRDRLLSGDVAAAFFDAVHTPGHALGRTLSPWMGRSWKHGPARCTFDAAEFRPRGPGNPTVNFARGWRRNDTHQSTTDPEAMLHRKATRKPSWRISATCCWTIDRGLSLNVLRDSTRRGPPNATRRTCCWPAPPNTSARSGRTRATMWRASLPTCASRTCPTWRRRSAGRQIHAYYDAGYHVSQRSRKLVEQVFGWMKTVGGTCALPASPASPWWIGSSPSPPAPWLRNLEDEVSLIAGRGCRADSRACTPRQGVRRSHRSNCCALCCCKCSTRCGASGCSWKSSTSRGSAVPAGSSGLNMA